MGAAAVMANTALATAGNLPLMAAAFRDAFSWVYLSAVVIAAVGFVAALLLRPVLLAPAKVAAPRDSVRAEMGETVASVS